MEVLIFWQSIFTNYPTLSIHYQIEKLDQPELGGSDMLSKACACLEFDTSILSVPKFFVIS